MQLEFYLYVIICASRDVIKSVLIVTRNETWNETSVLERLCLLTSCCISILGGTAEPSRTILAQAGVKYEDIRCEGEQWAKEYKEIK